MITKRLIFSLFLLFFNLNIYAADTIVDHNLDAKSPRKIYVFGASAASFDFRFNRDVKFTSASGIKILFKIRATPGITMHRIGRDGLDWFNITKRSDITQDDIAFFVFGETDCRTHIGRQRDTQKCDLSEIIDKLATAYIKTILANKNLVFGVPCAIVSVTPPTDKGENPHVPFYGTLADRVNITRSLNQKLKELCEQHNLIFIDIYDLYCNAAGALRPELSDGHVHVHPDFNTPLKEWAIKVLLEHKVL